MQLVSSFEVGGVQRLLVSLARGAQADPSVRHVYVIMNDPVDARLLKAIQDTGTPVVALGRRPGHLSLAHLWSLRRVFKLYRPAIIQTHNRGSRAWGMLLKLMFPAVRLVHTVHALGQVGRSGPASRFLSRRLISTTLAVSKSVQEECRRARMGDVALVENGVSLELFRPTNPTPGLPPADTPFRIVNVARFEPRVKGQDILIDALAICRSRGLDVCCSLVGPHPAPDELHELVHRLRLDDRVEFVVDPDDVVPWLHSANAFVLPSRSEAFGLALIEAMAAGLPVIASRTGGLVEIVQPEKNGLLFESGDADALANAIERLVRSPPLSRRLAAEGQKTAAEYSAERMAGRYHDLYRRILGRVPPRAVST